ncbi:MAG: response regulator, partial [Methanotrichaceae archaeon]
ILLAEDNPVNQKVTQRMLERLGYHADVAANGLEVLQLLQRQPYDVILMDIQMPEMDGLEAARRIRMLPKGDEIYIIAITAHALKGDRETCFNAGMNDYISKPVRIEDLQNALEHCKTYKEIKPALDPVVVSELRELQMDGESDILEELGGLFVSRAPEKIKAMADAISKGNAEGLRREAHTLKSSSANIGALNLSEICKELELLGRSGILKNAKSIIESAEIEFERVKAALEENKLKNKS